MPTGRWVWTLARLATRTFYRIERVGHPLPGGALLLVANHPNTLLDPAVIQTTAGRHVRFVAKSTLFRGHPMSLFVRHSGAIPVYRRMDTEADTSRNLEMFAAVRAALADGEAICLFPEGLSSDRGRLEPLRTGAARMALAAVAGGAAVSIVPVGLNFDHVSMFRSRATAVFGAPVPWTDLEPDTGADDGEAVRRLTDRLGQELRALMIEADPREELPLVTRVDRLYASARGVSRDPHDRVRRRRLIAEGLETLRREDPAALDDLLTSVHAYDERLARFGLRDHDLDRRVTRGVATRFAVREGLAALVLVPLVVASFAVFGLPYWLTGRISRFAPDLQSRATWKVVVGTMVYGLWIGAAAALVTSAAGSRTGGAVALGLVVLAFAGLAAFERERAVFRTVRAVLALRDTPLRARAQLKRQRNALAAVLEQVDRWLRDERRPSA